LPSSAYEKSIVRIVVLHIARVKKFWLWAKISCHHYTMSEDDDIVMT